MVILLHVAMIAGVTGEELILGRFGLGECRSRIINGGKPKYYIRGKRCAAVRKEFLTVLYMKLSFNEQASNWR